MLQLGIVNELHSSDRRTLVVHEDGTVVAWNLADQIIQLPDVVEVNAGSGFECYVRTSGQVDCTDRDDEQQVFERLRGAKQLAIGDLPALVVAVLPDGSLAAESLRDGEPPSFSPPGNIIELAPRDCLGNYVAIHRDGQVFEWKPDEQGKHYVAREIVLPNPSPPSPVAAEQARADEDLLLPVSAAEVKTAAERCNRGWSKFLAGDPAGAKLDIDAALTGLERAQDQRGLRSLGACLYNRGRIAEQAGDLGEARELYQRSLSVRPNATVQDWLDSLAAK